MANKKISELDQAPVPIPDTWEIAIADDSTGIAKRAPFSQLKSEIAPIFTALKVFYVDGNNSETGDGSILSPFQTLELAYNKVLGSGTVDAPEYENVAIIVAAAEYNTDQNIYLNNTTWHFSEGTSVTYSGTEYFIDTSVVSSSVGLCKVTGGLKFFTATGGFVKNHGLEVTVAGLNKGLDIEFYEVIGTTALGITSNPTISTPLIWIYQDEGAGNGGYSPLFNIFRCKNRIESKYQTVIYQQKGYVFFYGDGESLMGYGRDGVTSAQAGHADGCIHRFVNTDVGGQRQYMTAFKITNVALFGINNDYNCVWTGSCSSSYYRNLVTVEPSSNYNNAGRFLGLDGWSVVGYESTHKDRVYIENFKVVNGDFDEDDIIKIISGGANDELEMYNCILPSPYTIDDNITLGGDSYDENPVPCYNVINNQFRITNLPTYADNAAAVAGGLKLGDMYKTATGEQRITV